MIKIVKFDRKHAYCDASFYCGEVVIASRKQMRKVLGKESHTGEECEWLSSSVEWWRMLVDDDTVIPFKIYDYCDSGVLEDQDLVIPWRIGTERDKTDQASKVRDYLNKNIK